MRESLLRVSRRWPTQLNSSFSSQPPFGISFDVLWPPTTAGTTGARCITGPSLQQTLVGDLRYFYHIYRALQTISALEYGELLGGHKPPLQLSLLSDGLATAVRRLFLRFVGS